MQLLVQTPEPLHDITEYEEALQRRIDGTRKIANRVAEAIEKEHSRTEHLRALIREEGE